MKSGTSRRTSSAQERDGDFSRLEAAVRTLAKNHALVRAENHALRGQLDAKDRQIELMEAEASEIEGRRKNAIDRLDALLSEVESLASGCGDESSRAGSSRMRSVGGPGSAVNVSTRAGA